MIRVFIDIETLPTGDYPSLDEIQAPSNYKDPVKINAYKVANQEEKYRKRAVNSLSGRILCIGYAIEDAPALCIYSRDSEREVLERFNDIIAEIVHGYTSPPNLAFIAHNGNMFDFKWIAQRAIKYNLPAIKKYFPNSKFDSRGLDTMTLFGMTDYRDMSSMDNICAFLGIKSSKSEMDGSMVYEYWKDGKDDDIIKYCISDIYTLRDIATALDIVATNDEV